MSITKEIDIDGEWYGVTVGYRMVGKHYPATLTSPEEFPECEWWVEEAIDAEGNVITDLQTLKAIESELDRLSIAAECETHACEMAQ